MNWISRIISHDDPKRFAVPVLMYHEVTNEDQQDISQQKKYSPYSLSIREFEKQMDYLYSNNYNAVSPTELLKLAKEKEEIENDNKKYVLITFDDGYVGNYIYAYPILMKYKFKAVIFVIINKVGLENYLTWDQLMEMKENGIEIQSHTLSHKGLELLPTHEVQKEIGESKEILENKLDSCVRFISFPQGSYNQRIFDIAKKQGYAGSFTSEPGCFYIDGDVFQINRINIKRKYNVATFEKLLNQNLILYFKLKIIDYVKKILRKALGTELYSKIWIKIFS